jgi:hypothetical protein
MIGGQHLRDQAYRKCLGTWYSIRLISDPAQSE